MKREEKKQNQDMEEILTDILENKDDLTNDIRDILNDFITPPKGSEKKEDLSDNLLTDLLPKRR